MNDLTLRDYQTEIINETRQAFRNGAKRVLITLPCGAGKTVCFADMAAKSQERGKIVWFLVHRRELLDQTVETFERFGIPLETINIGMVGTYANRLDKLPAPDFIIFDECFPAGTLVDNIPIEKIEPGDYVSAYNHQTKSIEQKKVVSVSKRTAPERLIKINNAFACTPNHPIFITERNEYVEAENIKAGESLLFCMQQDNGMAGSSEIKKRPICEKWKNLLFKRMFARIYANREKKKRQNERGGVETRIRENESQKPNAFKRNTRESFKNAKRNETRTTRERRERNWIHCAAKKLFYLLYQVCHRSENTLFQRERKDRIRKDCRHITK